MPRMSVANIAYNELHAFSILKRAHSELHGDTLRAMVVFGELVARGEPYNINLLEVVGGWEGARRVSFASHAELPLRGLLRIYYLTPSEFENPSMDNLPNLHFSSVELLAEIQEAYSILLERPFGYASEILARIDTRMAAGDREVQENPLNYLPPLSVPH